MLNMAYGMIALSCILIPTRDMDLMQVKTLVTGEIDYEHFREVLEANKRRPAIVNVNCGTTVKGAVDDIDRVLAVLSECGYSEDRFYIHVDGALFGMMVSALIHHFCCILLPYGTAASYPGMQITILAGAYGC